MASLSGVPLADALLRASVLLVGGAGSVSSSLVFSPVVPTVHIVATGYVDAGPLSMLFGGVFPVVGRVVDYCRFLS
jgi:hypothetical protein